MNWMEALATMMASVSVAAVTSMCRRRCSTAPTSTPLGYPQYAKSPNGFE